MAIQYDPNGIYKVPTGSIGPDQQPIFDVFSGQEHIQSPTDPRLAGVNIPNLPTGQAPSGFQSQFDPVKTLLNHGAVTTGQLPEEKNALLKAYNDRLNSSDQLVSSILAQVVPTTQEQDLQKKIDELTGSAEAGIAQEATRNAPMSIITGRQAELQKQAQLKLAGLQRELTRLSGNREAQYNVLTKAYDIKRNQVNDLLEFYKSTSPENLYTDKTNGIAYFRNPITGEVTSTKLPDFQKEIPSTNIEDEFNAFKKAGYQGSLLDFAKYKATQYGTEQGAGTNEEKKIISNFNDSVSSWNLNGTREQFIRQLQAKYPEIDPSDIARKVYDTYPDNYKQEVQ